MDFRAHTNGVKMDCSRRGKSTDDAFVEFFDGRIWEEC
jgi:hypothetical protein